LVEPVKHITLVTMIKKLTDIGMADAACYGGKAAARGEARFKKDISGLDRGR
jgi:hypothetical protein